VSAEATPARGASREALVSSPVLGTALFVMAEVMLFAAFISAITIVHANAPSGWPPPGQPRLPVASTAINTVALLASAGFMWRAGRTYLRPQASTRRDYLAALALGTLFVVLQGREWVALIAEGLTLQSSSYGAFFYLIVGTHALHVLGALVTVAWLARRVLNGVLSADAFQALRLYWYFVVLLWPVLYWQVYLR
jgi:cytochrome c oxidase subunit 3